MTDAPATSPATPSSPAARFDDEPLTLPIVAYVLYLLGFFTGGISTLAGVIVAYVRKNDADVRAASHYVFLINTFWIVVVAYASALVLMAIGFPMLFLHGAGIVLFVLSGLLGTGVTVWFLARCVVGLIRAAQGDAYPAPRAWLL